MTLNTNKLSKEIAAILAAKLALIAVIWCCFFQGNQVRSDAQATATHLVAPQPQGAVHVQ